MTNQQTSPDSLTESHISEHQVAELNQRLLALNAEARIQLVLEQLPGMHVMTSSFGVQAAVMLHLLTQAKPDIAVVLLDTGYLFPETYRFIDDLQNRLALNLQVYSARMSPAMQEARFGQRWQQGVEGLEAFNHDNKVEPLKRAFTDLQVGTWFTGIRRDKGESRIATPFVSYGEGCFKVAPIADWSDRDIYDYLHRFDLPYHPLWYEGYVSIGDVHTTQSLHEVDDVSKTRFFGLKRECGIHA